MKKHGLALTLAVCITGLYGSFLSWSILQERINTKPYGVDALGSPEFFKAPLIVNLVQALFASLVGFAYSAIANHDTNPLAIFTSNESKVARRYFQSFAVIALCLSLSSPLGYQSLKHVDYVAYLLAKSCKLIPVMLVHIVCYRTRFPGYKYAVALLVTAGVSLFTVAHKKEHSKYVLNDERTMIGMAQLVGLMILDGITNSTQDRMFTAKHGGKKLTGAMLMCILNLFVFVLTLAYTVIFTNEVEYTVAFMSRHPSVLPNTVAFAAFGAVGQVFVFVILEKFDSLILVTATVTRKMLSMILSVVLFGHHLNMYQWMGVGLVFGGIGYEASLKFRKSKSKKE